MIVTTGQSGKMPFAGVESKVRMRRLAAIAITLSLCALSGCTAMLIGGGKPAGPAIGSDSRSSAQVARDDAIETEVRAAFSADNVLRGSDLVAHARAGIVTLSGTVSSFEMRDRAIQLARKTSGVSRVNNQIQVKTLR